MSDDDDLALVSSGESYVTVHAKPATYLAGFQHVTVSTELGRYSICSRAVRLNYHI